MIGDREMTTMANDDAGRIRRRSLPLAFVVGLALASCAGADSDPAKKSRVGTSVGQIGELAVGAESEDDPSGASSGFVYYSYKSAQEN